MMKSISHALLKDKLVLLRIDINSPVAKGKIEDNPRFKEAAKTIKFLLKKKVRVVIIAHQGRPGDSDFLDLKQHAKLLTKYAKHTIRYIPFLFESQSLKAISKLKSGQAILLKNVRSYKDELNSEKKNNSFLAFSKHFDLFINEAFSVSHRDQASITLPPKVIPGYIGPAFEKELQALEGFSFNAKTIYLIGGSKIQDYLPLFDNLKNKESKILASGILANLLLVAKGVYLGYENQYLKEKGFLELIPKLREIYQKYKDQIILPVDFAIDNNGKRQEVDISDFPVDSKILDLGKNSVELFKQNIKGENKIFMKGPLGYSELPQFSFATVEILKYLSELSTKGSFSLLGGGHLTTTIDKYKIKNSFSHISKSGGALIAYISGKELPGISAIQKSTV